MSKRIIKGIFKLGGVDIRRYNTARTRYSFLYKRYSQYTMVSEEEFIQNLDLCNSFKNVPGDYVECGVWRGGMSSAIAEVLGRDRHIHLFDSFEGLPPAKEIDGKEALAWQENTTAPRYYDNCTADEKFAIDAMKMAGHKNYTVYKGWFEKTLPGSIQGPIAILRLDGDWYDSIMACLQNLFPLIIDGGIVLLDDYYTWEGCTKAVHDYLAKTKSPSRVYQWNNQIAYIVKRS